MKYKLITVKTSNYYLILMIKILCFFSHYKKVFFFSQKCYPEVVILFGPFLLLMSI